MVFPFGNAKALPLSGFPSLPPAHGPARPPRRPLARSWPSMISTLVTLIMGTSLGAEPPGPQAAGDLPEGGPISFPQDLYLNFTIDNYVNELITRGVPPGGEEDGKKEGHENLSTA